MKNETKLDKAVRIITTSDDIEKERNIARENGDTELLYCMYAIEDTIEHVVNSFIESYGQTKPEQEVSILALLYQKIKNIFNIL